jgi:hypothetical protein
MIRLVQRLKPWLVPLLVLFAMGTVPFLGFLFSDKMFYGSDQIGGYCNFTKMAEMLRHFTVYGWHPWYLSGMPTLDSIFGEVLYPFFWPIILLCDTTRALGLLFWTHTLLSGLFATVLFRRSFKLERWPATAVAAAYMLNLNFLSVMQGGHTGKVYIMAWLPLGLHCLIRLLSRSSRWYHPLGLSVTVGMMILTAHLQMVYYILIGFFLYLCWRLWEMAKERAGLFHIGGKFLAFWMAILLGIGLSMPVFYPPTQYTKQFSVRNTAEKTTFEHGTSWSLHWEEAASLVVPEFTGINENYWGRNPFKLNSEYAGIAITALGIAAAVILRSRWSWFWVGIAVLALLNGLGAETPFYSLIWGFDLPNGTKIAVPGIRNFRAPSMIMFWWAMAMCALTAMWFRAMEEVDSWDKARREKIRKGLLRAGGITALVLVLMAVMPDTVFSVWTSVFSGGPDARKNLADLWAQNSGAFQLGAFRTALLAGGLLVLASLWVDGRIKRPVMVGAFLLALALDIFPLAGKFLHTFDYSEYYAEEPALTALKHDTTTWRTMEMPGSTFSGQMILYGIQSAGGSADNEMAHEQDFRGKDYKRVLKGLHQFPDGSIAGSRTLDLLNVKYLVFRAGEDRSAPLGTALNRSVLPRIRLVSSVQPVALAGQLDRILDSSFAYRTQVLIDPTELAKDPVAASLADAPVDSVVPGSVSWTNPDPDHWTISVNTPKAALLALSEPWYIHWHARVDGKPVEILRTDYALRSIAVPAGQHEVEMYFHSAWVEFGFKVAGASFAALLLWSVFGFALQRRDKGSKGR